MQPTDLPIELPDGYRLAGTRFTPPPGVPLRGGVLIAPATGIRRQFYTAFAEYLASRGYGVLTFDNRGIGDSRHGPLSAATVRLQDWGEVDLPAALRTLQDQFPNTRYHLVGHSAGGQLVGLMPNWRDLSSIFNFACSSGRVRNMEFPFVVQAHFFMNVFIPLNNALFGYTNAQWLGMGEPLPKRVAQQWREWCNGRGYVRTAFGTTVTRHWYDAVDLPALWINAADDPIALDANVADMLAVFPRMPAERLRLVPADYGLAEIGHMKFFSRKNKVLWELAAEWLEKH